MSTYDASEVRPPMPVAGVRTGTRGSRFLLWMWALVVFLTPLYLGKSGRPQVADFLAFGLALLVIPLLILERRVPRWIAGITGRFALFVAYVVIVNISWALMAGQGNFFFSALYYIYLLLYLYLALFLDSQHGERFLRVTLLATFASLLIVCPAVFLEGAAARAQGPLRESNQLGYFALVSANVFYLGGIYRSVTRVPIWVLLLGIILSVVAGLASGSRAALVGLAALALISLISGKRRIVALAMVGIAVFVAMSGVVVAVAIPQAPALLKKATIEDELGQRGYDRFLIYPEQMIVGAGEGYFDRFSESASGKHEIHSSWGTVLFSYGIVGSALFLAFIWSIVRRVGWRVMAGLTPVFLYGVSHQGLRFRPFWQLLALVIGMGIALREHNQTNVVAN